MQNVRKRLAVKLVCVKARTTWKTQGIELFCVSQFIRRKEINGTAKDSQHLWWIFCNFCRTFLPRKHWRSKFEYKVMAHFFRHFFSLWLSRPNKCSLVLTLDWYPRKGFLKAGFKFCWGLWRCSKNFTPPHSHTRTFSHVSLQQAASVEMFKLSIPTTFLFHLTFMRKKL